MICLVLSESTITGDLATLAKYRSTVDLAELRADFLDPSERRRIPEFPSLAGLPVILTVRRVSDGGRFGGEESERVSLLEKGLAGPRPYAFIDLEEDLPPLPEIEMRAANRKTAVIRSLHDFAGIPPDLERRVVSMPRSDNEMAKAAVTPGSTADLVRLLGCAERLHREHPTSRRLVIGMGPYGVPSRILSRRFGSFFTFASPSGLETAPGHLDPETLLSVYRFRELTPQTKIFGIIGNPVLHSRSPAIHNPAFGRLGMDAAYIPFQLDDIRSFPRLANAFEIGGLSVTVPYKEAVVPFLHGYEDAVQRIGACNTVVASPDGWTGYNTDAEGFLTPLEGRGIEVGTLRATVLGAGGAARSVVYALRSRGASVLVLNRTPARAKALAEEFGCSWGGLDAEGFLTMGSHADLIVQTTTSGMSPDEDGDASEGYDFTGREIAYDIVYHPRMTKFLNRASRAGCRIIGGEEMLLGQAYRQFSLFTGAPFPGI